MLPQTYVARRSEAFASLIQSSALGGFRLVPLAPVRVRDVYWDTAAGGLLAAGLALRVREADGVYTASLRPLTEAAAAAAAPTAPLVLGHTASAVPLALPAGPLAQAVRRAAEGSALHPLVALRQYRTPRVAFDGDRAALLVSLDVVVAETPGAQVVSNEAEVEAAEPGRADDVARLDAALRAFGLEPEGRSKFERALLRLPRPADAPLLLLPDERSRLGALAGLADPLLRRRARAVLLHADGERAAAIAVQTGLSTARVRYWTERFRDGRMTLFDPGDPAPLPVAAFDTAAVLEPAAATAAPRPTVAAGEEAPGGGDLDSLLSAFAPGHTATPLFDDVPDAEPPHERPDGAPAPAAAGEPNERSAERPPRGDAPAEMWPGRGGSTRPLGPGEPRPGRAGPSSSPRAASGDGARHAPGAPGAATPAPSRRLGLPGETSLIEAARRTLLVQVVAFEAAAARVARSDDPADARRLGHAATGVRVAAETFHAVLPERAAGRLVAALRPLAAALTAYADAARAAEQAADAPGLRGRADRARVDVLAHLHSARQRAWRARASRLLERLAAQSAAGLLVGDDLTPAPDDLVGQPGDVAVPVRLRHALASALWARFEAVRAFEDDVAAETEPETAAHLAVAVRALRLTLALAEAAASEPVGPLAARLAAAERHLVGYRTARRTAALAAEYGGTPPHTDVDDATLARVFAAVVAPGVRRALARIAASV